MYGLKRWKSVALMGALAAFPLQLAYAQAAPAADPMAPAPPAGAQPAQPAETPPPPSPLELPPPLWQVADAQELLAFINSVGSEGLVPADYDPQGLALAMRSGDPLAMSKAATDRFYKVASDLAHGHVRGEDRGDWHVTDDNIDEAQQR